MSIISKTCTDYTKKIQNTAKDPEHARNIKSYTALLREYAAAVTLQKETKFTHYPLVDLSNYSSFLNSEEIKNIEITFEFTQLLAEVQLHYHCTLSFIEDAYKTDKQTIIQAAGSARSKSPNTPKREQKPLASGPTANRKPKQHEHRCCSWVDWLINKKIAPIVSLFK